MVNSTFKKAVTILASVACLASLTACGAAAASESSSATNSNGDEVRTIQAVTGGTPAPYTLKNTDNKPDGQNIELVQEVFKRLPQYKLEISFAEFKGIFPGLDSGRYQIAVNNFAKTPEREQKYIFSTPMYKNEYVAVVSEQSGIKNIDSLSDLAGKTTITSADGSNVQLALQKYNQANPDNTIKLEYNSADQVNQLQQVKDGKVDFSILDAPTVRYYEKKIGLKLNTVELSDKVDEELQNQNYSYLVFPKGEEKLRDDVNKALQEIIKDGTSKKIDEKWFGADQTPDPDAK
ncbi:transporter substrate-binding domain-containing protein [Bifidobacterium oedipodis]|uniref:Amino acid ABC transporter substrate-binding protein n=1 Tax=Bifidobacterium oedipodis TaxID=2675322 RepID=A0A7Y0EMA8_9BIFI|nr:transporter substrate-binding domain-containing protein [Bifidobacterium sp. DSM 109957]NMM92877.1 amino acid ABC transporter substrate-binding protein [Bifidobacterium sp. DSM 109957]